jgi:hypothetical protein
MMGFYRRVADFFTTVVKLLATGYTLELNPVLIA